MCVSARQWCVQTVAVEDPEKRASVAKLLRSLCVCARACVCVCVCVCPRVCVRACVHVCVGLCVWFCVWVVWVSVGEREGTAQRSSCCSFSPRNCSVCERKSKVVGSCERAIGCPSGVLMSRARAPSSLSTNDTCVMCVCVSVCVCVRPCVCAHQGF